MAKMTDIKANDIEFDERGPGKSVQEILEHDENPAPSSFREESFVHLGTEDLSTDRYLSKDWHDQEVEKVWRKTWQVACRVEEIPEIGDYVVYDIVFDSLIVVRTGADEVRAYHNACLHRGNALCLETGSVTNFRCPYHGFTWSLEGRLSHVPSDWDFQHIDKEEFCLPEAEVGIWGGFVFVNMDPDCTPLQDYLELLPAHLDGFEFEKRYKAVHVSQVVPCNWKVVQEAFIEGYHVAETHYEKDSKGNVDPDGIAAISDDVMVQYDTWPESSHVTRLILAGGVQSQYVAHHQKPEQHIVDTMLRRLPEDERPRLEPGQKARPVLAEFNRRGLSKVYGVDFSKVSDSDVLDQVQYTLFPNFTFWPTHFAPLCYRFRPNGDTPDEAIFEVFMLYPIPEDGRPFEPMEERRLAPGEIWSSVKELGVYGPIIDQDTPNLNRMRKGLRATRKPGVSLANYQESRIRHFHSTLEAYLKAE